VAVVTTDAGEIVDGATTGAIANFGARVEMNCVFVVTNCGLMALGTTCNTV
jgi:hypothetical protein